jgi:hypothetical protein
MMSDATTPNPLAPATPEQIQRQRERAYYLWERDGCPDGHADEYWERAGELLAMQDHPDAGLLAPDAVERPDEAELQENLGEFPDRLADQGEHRGSPMRRDQEKAMLMADATAEA